jgi:membrane protease YdiL (CAAX protease family)
LRAQRALARHPIAWFLAISIGVSLAAALTTLVADIELTRFDLPLYGSVGTFLGVGVAAFVVTAAADGREGVDDLVRRCLRWRVPVRWYLLALFGVPVATTLLAVLFFGREGLASPSTALAVFVLFLLQFVFFNYVEEIGWTGFFQDRLRDRYSPLKLSAVVAFPWAVWHMPDYLADEGWTLAALAVAPVFLVYETILLFFARVLIVWLYEGAGRSVLIVGIFHASFDATITKLSREIIPASDAVRFLIVTGVIVLGACAVIALSFRAGPRRGGPARSSDRSIRE